jgi:hypothetical protein
LHLNAVALNTSNRPAHAPPAAASVNQGVAISTGYEPCNEPAHEDDLDRHVAVGEEDEVVDLLPV